MDELLERLRAAVPGMAWRAAQAGRRPGAEGSLGDWLYLSVRPREDRPAGGPVTAFNIYMSVDDDSGTETTAIGLDAAVAEVASVIRGEAEIMMERAREMLDALPSVETESEATENRAT